MGSDNTGSVSPDALRQAAKRWRDDHPDMFPLLVFFTNICVFHSASQRNTHITTTSSIITIHDLPPLPSSLQRTLLGTTSSSSTFCMSRLLISLTYYPHTACTRGASPRTWIPSASSPPRSPRRKAQNSARIARPFPPSWCLPCTASDTAAGPDWSSTRQASGSCGLPRCSYDQTTEKRGNSKTTGAVSMKKQVRTQSHSFSCVS